MEVKQRSTANYRDSAGDAQMLAFPQPNSICAHSNLPATGIPLRRILGGHSKALGVRSSSSGDRLCQQKLCSGCKTKTR